MSEFQHVKMSEVQLWPVKKLEHYENNAKRHPQEQVEKIASSIKEFGWKANPIEITPEGLIVNGHGRLMAAELLELKQVPVAIIEGLSPNQIRAYRLAHNKVAESPNDANMLTLEISELMGDGFDMSSYFNERELQFSLEDIGEMDLGALTEDLAGQIDEISGSTQDYIDGEDDEANLSLVKTMGFSRVTASQQRVLKRFVMHVEMQTGKKGGDAVVEYIVENMGI